MEKVINILFIAGAGRGGSTLLGDALGMLPGTLHIGELRGIFDYVTDSEFRCSCQEPYATCPFWGLIFENAYGSCWQDRIRPFGMEGRLPRALQLPLLSVRKSLLKNFELPFQVSLREVVRLLQIVQSQTTFRVLVDSSKAASFAWLLAQQPEIRMVVVHLVRDPRASLFSWTRRPIPIFDRTVRRALVRTRTWTEGVQYWIRATMAAYILKLVGIPYMRVKYEDFVACPETVVEQIVAFAQSRGIPLEPEKAALLFLRQNRIVLQERHLLGGNPGVKSKKGLIAIKEDTAWLRELSVPQRLLWTLIFLPWILWFGYSLWPKVQSLGDHSG